MTYRINYLKQISLDIKHILAQHVHFKRVVCSVGNGIVLVKDYSWGILQISVLSYLYDVSNGEYHVFFAEQSEPQSISMEENVEI